MKQKCPPINMIFLLLLTSLLMCFGVPVHAQEASAEMTEKYVEAETEENDEYDEFSYRDDTYYISRYHIDMIVNEDNSYQITEKISAYFTEESQGIYRNIPLRNEVVRLDGTTAVTHAKISNISVNEMYSQSTKDNYRILQIGNEYKPVIGEQYYAISYLYNLGDDKAENFDELYFNLVGSEWDAVSENITFTITMPKEFDHEKVGFSSGVYGSVENSNVTYTIEGNVITGSLAGILKRNEALTVRLELEEGYFVKAPFTILPKQLLLFIVPLICGLAAFLIWRKYGKDLKVVSSVEFRPPGNYNSLEIAYLYKDYVSISDVLSLLVYLANKGYLKLSQSTREAVLKGDSLFSITKLKEYDGTNINERLFLEGLFSCGKTAVTAVDLYNKFHTTITKIENNFYKKEIGEKLFEKESKIRFKFFLVLMLIIWCIGIGIPTFEYGNVKNFLITMAISFFYTPFLSMIFVKAHNLAFNIIAGMVTIPITVITFWSMPVGVAMRSEGIYLLGVMVCITGIVTMIVFLVTLPKRTPEATKLLGKIQGFKEFLETADKDRLEALVMEDPAYFYDILPYTYALGVSDIWIKKFDGIALQVPEWYYGSTFFDTRAIQYFMGSSMPYASKTPPGYTFNEKPSRRKFWGRRSSDGGGSC